MMELQQVPTDGGALVNRSLVYLAMVTAASSTNFAMESVDEGGGGGGVPINETYGGGLDLLLHQPAVILVNGSGAGLVNENYSSKADPICIILPITIFYCFIFVAGIVGNLAICIVIAKNRSMHTATNYYLFNLAVSDFLLLLFGMPLEVYGTWYPFAYPFNQVACIITGLLSETATNATVLTITSFTVERYIAICHPFRSHTMSKLSRAIKFVIAIWLVAFGLATPQALQFGVVENGHSRLCTIKNRHFEHAFEVSSFLFFVGPMTVIAVLYVLIGIKLRKSKLLQGVKRQGPGVGASAGDHGHHGGMATSGGASSRAVSGQTRVIRMLVAVVATFFFCWAPFHAQRLMAVYGSVTNTDNEFFFQVYTYLTYISGILYFLSTCINPLLYHIMSHKFRDASRRTLKLGCCRVDSKRSEGQTHTYSALSRYGLTGNGGSFKLASNIHYGTPVSAIRPSSDLQFCHQQESELSLLRSDPGRCRKAESHCVSISSQSTTLSTSGMARSSSVERKQPNGRPNCRNSGSFGSRGSIRVSSGVPQENGDPGGRLSTIAEKLRRGTKKVLQFSKSPSTSPTKTSSAGNGAPSDQQDGKRRWLRKKESVDSVDTNTISNSSLKEYDEEEFSSAELARFMAEINNEIR
ncbi:pyrokinin-1 receptor-like [Ochlerotatus camptorhynchus]|uniref:pyrokinin-1 receptor-like n=1 Tax=Ochlerotatus camptorhynchus TaxID=644619 RepID=UPI0031D8CB7B